MSVSSVVRLHPLALAVLALMAAPVGAQTAPEKKTEADEGALEKVVVTARKREETLQDSPVAVTALTAQSLDRLNIKNLGDLQGNVPSLTVYAARGSNSTITTFIRGVGQADPLWGVDPGVGIYLDDVYMARPQGALLEVFDVQRIEVLRGPQGTLYGKNTIGGAVKYVSRPLGTKTEGVASLTLGDYGQRQFKAALGGGTDSGEWRGRVAVAKAQRDGFGKNLTDGTDVSNQDTEAARVQLGWFPSSLPLSVQFAADRTNDHSNMRGFQRMATNKFIANDVLDPSRYDIASGMPNANMTEAGGHAWTVNFDLSKDWSGKFISSYRSSDTDTSIDFDGRPNKVADVRAFYSDHARSHELQFTRAGGGVIGLYRFEGQAGGQVRNNFFNLSFGDTRGEVYTSSTAAYADWDWELTSALTLSAGLRATREEKRAVVLNRAYSDATFTTPTATVSNFDKTRTVNNTSPKLSLGYELSRDTKLYATASRGFKSGGYNIRANVTAVPSSSKPFEDETLDSLEVGAKMLFDQGRLELNAAAFHNSYKNVQLSVFTSYTQANGQPGFFGDFTNAGKATVNGLELEWIWRPTRNWTFKGNAAVLDAKYDEYLDKGVNIADQKKFSNTPKVSGAMDVEYRTAFPLGGEVRTRVGVSYRSKVYPTTDLSEVIAQTGYALWSAGVIWERDRNWTFALQGSNLSDKAYRTDGYNIPALGVLNGFYGAPRQVSFTTTYRF